MSQTSKITIEKRIFNLGNNEKFTLEYPSNYNEIINKKLTNLQKDYDSTNKNIIKNTNNLDNTSNDKNINNESLSTDSNKLYYQPIGSNALEFEEKENVKNNIKLEPQEGHIEIKKKNIKKEKEEEENNEEFYEIEEEENNNISKNDMNERKKEKKKEILNTSPVKNTEEIKLSMKKLNFKAPKWAEKMNDEDFINLAKKIISSKQNT